jgi:hypothetical protein
MDTVVGKFVANSKKKKVLKTAPARKKLVSGTSKPVKGLMMTNSEDEPPKKKATPSKPTMNKPRKDGSEDDSDKEEFHDNSDNDAPQKKSAFDKVAKRTPSKRALRRKQVKKAIVDIEFDEMPKAPIRMRMRATANKVATKKPTVEPDLDAEIDDEHNEDNNNNEDEEAFAVDLVTNSIATQSQQEMVTSDDRAEEQHKQQQVDDQQHGVMTTISDHGNGVTVAFGVVQANADQQQDQSNQIAGQSSQIAGQVQSGQSSYPGQQSTLLYPAGALAFNVPHQHAIVGPHPGYQQGPGEWAILFSRESYSTIRKQSA